MGDALALDRLTLLTVEHGRPEHIVKTIFIVSVT